MRFSSLFGNSSHPFSSSTASKTGRGMSVKELLSLDLDDLVDSPLSDDPLDFLRWECFGIGFSVLDSTPWFELRRRRELRELPSWGPESPEGHDERCRLDTFSEFEFRRVDEESRPDEDSDDVWRFDLGARLAFCTSSSPDSIQRPLLLLPVHQNAINQTTFYITNKVKWRVVLVPWVGILAEERSSSPIELTKSLEVWVFGEDLNSFICSNFANTQTNPNP